MSYAIEVNNLCKEYPGFALKNVNFSVPSGLCCGFVGPNGAGKTTTLKTMLGNEAIFCGSFITRCEAALVGRAYKRS